MVKQLKKQVEDQEKRIKALEDKMVQAGIRLKMAKLFSSKSLLTAAVQNFTKVSSFEVQFISLIIVFLH